MLGSGRIRAQASGVSKLSALSSLKVPPADPGSAGAYPGRSGSGRDLKIVDALTALIERMGLRVGDRLPPEIELARLLNCGRSTVRETLKAWQGMGIVVRNKGAGTTLMVDVSNSIQVPLTLKLEAESLLRTQGVRRPLEVEATRLAALNASRAERQVIRARLEDLMDVFDAGEDWRPADHRFHAAIHTASGNPLFAQLIRQIQQAFGELYSAPFGQPHLGQASLPMHRDLAEAVTGGDAAVAMRIIGEIMDVVDAEVRAIVNERD